MENFERNTIWRIASTTHIAKANTAIMPTPAMQYFHTLSKFKNHSNTDAPSLTLFLHFT